MHQRSQGDTGLRIHFAFPPGRVHAQGKPVMPRIRGRTEVTLADPKLARPHQSGEQTQCLASKVTQQ